MRESEPEAQPYKRPDVSTFTLEGRKFELVSNQPGTRLDYSVWNFVQKNWYDPQGTFDNSGLSRSFVEDGARRGLEKMAYYVVRDEDDNIKNLEEKIIAVCFYKPIQDIESIDEDTDNFFLVLTRQDERKKGIGSYLSSKAIEALIASAKIDGPVEIKAEATTQEGTKTLIKIKQQFGDRIKLMVRESYKYSKDALPEGFEFNYSYEIKDHKDQIGDLINLYIEKDLVYLPETQKQQLSTELWDKFLNLHDSIGASLINDAGGKIIALVGHQLRGKNEEDVTKKELVLCSVLPQYQDQKQNILRVLLNSEQEEIFAQDYETVIGLLTRDISISEIVQELGFIEIPLEDYLSEMQYDESNTYLEQMRESNFKAFVKRGTSELPRQEITLNK